MTRMILSGAIIFAVIWFAVTNATAIHINAFFWNISISTAIVVFISFVLGFVFGVLRVAPSWFRKSAQVGKHQKALDVCQQENKEHTQRIKELEIELATEREKLHAEAEEKDQMSS